MSCYKLVMFKKIIASYSESHVKHEYSVAAKEDFLFIHLFIYLCLINSGISSSDYAVFGGSTYEEISIGKKGL
jgi:hypothetical protein